MALETAFSVDIAVGNWLLDTGRLGTDQQKRIPKNLSIQASRDIGLADTRH